MADKIKQFFAPTQELRSSPAASAAWETAARRIGPAYADIARNERAQGQIAADLFKQTLWPLNMAKLYAQRDQDAIAGAASDARKLASQSIGFRVRGVNNTFGGPTETFSEDPTRDFDGHAQVSRGAGALGRALGDGGYGLASMTHAGAYPGKQEIDPVTGLPVYPRDYTKFNAAQAARRKFNSDESFKPAQEDYEGKIATQDYWTQYYGGKGSQYQTDQTINQAIRDSVLGQGGPPAIPDASDDVYFKGLRDFISNLGGGSISDTSGRGAGGM